MNALTLLLLSGGGHTGANVMATLAARRQELRLIASSDQPDEPTLFAFDAVYLAPPLAEAPAEFEARILAIMTREAVDLIIPCRDEDVNWLAGLRARQPELAPRLLCGAAPLAEVVSDKWLSHEFARQHGLPFARTLPTGDAQPISGFLEQVGLPVVLKPRHGANSRGVFLLDSAAQVAQAMTRRDAVLQEFLGDREKTLREIEAMRREGIPLVHDFMGEKHSIQLLLGPDGACVSLACTVNLMEGRITRRVHVDPSREAQDIGMLCAQVFARAGWCGPLNVQCQRAPDGELRIHEFNGRFTGATAARWALGIDEVGLALRSFTGHELPGPSSPWGVPLTARESLVARAAAPLAVECLAQAGQWRPTSGAG
ncbi:MAG: hypothetical protein HYZ17_05475 [Betaproteobacteria bacterium]|nr:hypothetical protein [Betaproteobacteria bacterium]